MNQRTTREHTISIAACTFQSEQQHPPPNQHYHNVMHQMSVRHQIDHREFQHHHQHHGIPQNYFPEQSERFDFYHGQQRYSEELTDSRYQRKVPSNIDQCHPPGQPKERCYTYHSQGLEALFPPEASNYSQTPMCSFCYCRHISGYEVAPNPVLHRSDHRILDEMPHQQKTYAHNPNMEGTFHSQNQRPHNYQQTTDTNISQQIQQLQECLMKQMNLFDLRFQNIEKKLEILEMKQESSTVNDGDISLNKELKELTIKSLNNGYQSTEEHSKQGTTQYSENNSTNVPYSVENSQAGECKPTHDSEDQSYNPSIEPNSKPTEYTKEMISDESNVVETEDLQDSEEIFLQSPNFSSETKKLKEVVENIPIPNVGPLKNVRYAQAVINQVANAHSFHKNPLGYVAKVLTDQRDKSDVLNTVCNTIQLFTKKKRGSDILTSVAANLLGEDFDDIYEDCWSEKISGQFPANDEDPDYRNDSSSEENSEKENETDSNEITNVNDSESEKNSYYHEPLSSDLADITSQNTSKIFDYGDYCYSSDEMKTAIDLLENNSSVTEKSEDNKPSSSKNEGNKKNGSFSNQSAAIANSNTNDPCGIDEDADITITNESISVLSKNLSLGECHTLCRALGLSDGIISDTKIEQHHHGCEENRYVLLQKWKQQCGLAATNRKLIKALLSLNRADIIATLFPDYVKNHPNKEIFYKRVTLPSDLAKEKLEIIQAFLKSIYGNVVLPVAPWLECKELSLEKLYVDLTMFPKDKDGVEEKGKEMTLPDIFKEVYGEHPYRILVEGPPGYGKSTLTYKLALDWAKNETYMDKFYLLFIVALRYFECNLEETLINECKIEDIDEATKLAVIRQYEKHVLLVLDGYDELSDNHKASLNALLRGEKFPRMTVLLTSRTGLFKLPLKKEEYSQRTGGLVSSQKGKQLSFWRKRIEIKGISEDKRKQFLQTYLNINADKLYEKLDHVMSNEMRNLYQCPLILLLLALLVEDKGFEQIKTKTHLYKEVFNFIVRRSLVREELINKEVHVDLFASNNNESYVNLLIKFGEFALKKLEKSSLMFSEKEILENCNNDEKILKLGFLTKNVKLFHHEKKEFFEPIHKTFLEFLAALFLWQLCSKSFQEHGKFMTMMVSLMKHKIMEQKDSLLFTFLAGLLEDKTTILLTTLARWSYALTTYEFPISTIIKETQCFAKFINYFIPFIPPLYQETDSSRNELNQTVTRFAIQEKRIKIISLNVHKMNNVPMEINADIVQLDIWGKDIKGQIRFNYNRTISCRYLFCWIYGITEENWNCYAKFIHSIKTEEISFIINAYDDYKQIPIILTKMENELSNGLWKGMNIKFLKVLGLDGKNDRESLPLIAKFIQNKIINNGLVVSIKSVFSAFETFSFWFRTRFMRAFTQTTNKFFKYLNGFTCFREHLKPEVYPVILYVKKNIKKLKLQFGTLFRNFDTKFNIFTDDDSDSSSDELQITKPLLSSHAEEKMNRLFRNMKTKFSTFYKKWNDLFESIQKDSILELLPKFQGELRGLVKWFCKYLEEFIDSKFWDLDLRWSDDDDYDYYDSDGDISFSKIAKFAKHGVAVVNTFNKEMKLLLNAVTNSNLQRFALCNGYVSLKIPRIDATKMLIGREWDYFHIENKFLISSNVRNTNTCKFKIHNLGIISGMEKVENETSLLLRCSNLLSLSCKTSLLSELEGKNWAGFKSLNELYWYLCDDDEYSSCLLKDFTNLRLLSITAGGILESESFEDFPHLPFDSLKMLEIRDIGSENVNICKVIINNMLEHSHRADSLSVQLKNKEASTKPKLEEMKLDLQNLIDDEDLEEIFSFIKLLLLEKNVMKLTLIGPNDFQEPIITELFSFDEHFNIARGIDEFHGEDLMFFHQDVKSSSDIKIQWTISSIN